MLPRSGDVVYVNGAASVQFQGDRALYFRVIRICDGSTWDGWKFLDGYQLGDDGCAVEQRVIYVRLAGLHLLHRAADPKYPRAADARTRQGPSSAPEGAVAACILYLGTGLPSGHDQHRGPGMDISGVHAADR